MKKNKYGIGQYILAAIIISLAIIALLPVLLVLIASFTSEKSIAMNGYSFFPEEWSLGAWAFLGQMGDQVIRSYINTIVITVVGTFGSLFFTSMLAYTLSRPGFKLRGFLIVYLLTTMLFHGGQLSSYMVVTGVYKLRDKLIALMIPGVGAMSVFMMRTYIKNSIGDSLIEAARIDGAGEFRCYLQVCVPLMPPVLASLGFMSAVGYWNAWEGANLYITSTEKYPLQLLLMKIETRIQAMDKIPPEVQALLGDTIPSQSTRMAMLFTVLGPIMIAYPFFQRYFIKGLTMGGVKG